MVNLADQSLLLAATYETLELEPHLWSFLERRDNDVLVLWVGRYLHNIDTTGSRASISNDSMTAAIGAKVFIDLRLQLVEVW